MAVGHSVALARTVRLGDRVVPRIGLGTNRLTRTHVDLVRRAVEAGIGMIDSAHLYTGGESETTIGEALGGASTDGSVVVATKGGYSPGEGRPEVLRRQIEQSLRSLRTPTIDLYFLHRVDPETPVEDSLGAIRDYVDRGAIRHVGLSQVDVDVIERARTILPIAAVQNGYSLVERRYDAVVDHCEREGIVFVPFSPLRGVSRESVERIARARGISTAQVAIAWLLHRSSAILPIPGTLSVDHLRQNVDALDIELEADEMAELSGKA